MRKLTFLLPCGFRFAGFVFAFTGTILSIMRFYFGVKPDIFEQKAFAIYSVYLGTKTLSVVNNQLIDEIALILFITGLFMVAFAREKIENQQVNSVRQRAFFISFYLNAVFLIAATMFTFGLAFMYMTVLNLALPLLLYIITFRILAAIALKNSQV